MNFIKVLAAVSLATVGLTHASVSLAQGTAYVVHGIPGEDLGLDPALPVDVSLNGVCTLQGIEFGDIVGPVGLDAGLYDIDIALANPHTPCSNEPVLMAPGIEIEDGENYSIVAHLDEAGDITASVLVNSVSSSKVGALLNVAHVAAAPRVDIKLKRERQWWSRGRTIRDVGNGEIASTFLGAGDFNVSISPAGSRHPVFGPVPVSFDRDVVYGAYAVGSLESGTFTVLLTTLENAAPATAEAWIVHGIQGADLGTDPALPVDVSVNGECLLPNFTFGEIVGPLDLDAGTYDIAIGFANEVAPCSEAPVIEAKGLELEGGESYSIVAHLTEDFMPTASVFANDTHANRWFANVNVFHTAAAPHVDVKFQRSDRRFWNRFLRNVGNGEAGSIPLFAGSWDASIRPAGSRDTVFGPATLPLQGDTVYLVYAVGSLSNETFTLLLVATDGQDN